MSRRVERTDVALIASALLACVLIKVHYRQASAEELCWLLGPTSLLTGWLTGHEFLFEGGAGYVNRELGLVIAPVCAGANYFVVALATLVAGFVPRLHSFRAKLCWTAASSLVAYVATLLTNSLRITGSVLSRPLMLELSAAQRAEWHRIEGVVVFLSSLFVLCGIAHALLPRTRQDHFAPLWLPLACYLAVTLLVPLLLGAGARPEFLPHALVVLTVGAAVVALGRGLKYTKSV